MRLITTSLILSAAVLTVTPGAHAAQGISGIGGSGKVTGGINPAAENTGAKGPASSLSTGSVGPGSANAGAIGTGDTTVTAGKGFSTSVSGVSNGVRTVGGINIRTGTGGISLPFENTAGIGPK